MQFKFAFDSDPRIERTREIDHQFSTGSDVHDHTPRGRESCVHEHIDFCIDCNEFYCLNCTEQHYRLRKVFLERFLVSDHCQSMETLRDYLLEDGFIVGVPPKQVSINPTTKRFIANDFGKLALYLKEW